MTSRTRFGAARPSLAASILGIRGRLMERLAVELCYRSGVSRIAAHWTAGRGAIYVFHSTVPDRAARLNPDVRTTPDFLDHFLASLRRADIDILAMDRLLGRLESADRRRFVVVTFDDGHADNLHHALPVFEKYQAPLTIYVVSGLITGSFHCWWLALERLFLNNDDVEIPAMGRRWSVGAFAQKAMAYKDACDWVVGDVRARAPLLQPVFARYGLSPAAIAREIGLNAEQLRSLARHPLVTIGAHTETHAALAQLPEADVSRELAAGKHLLETLVDKPVEHLAYPFGWAGACGPREAELAKAAGYRTAVTTRHGCLFDRHLRDPHLLPRVGINRPYESIGLAWVQIDGLAAALRRRLRPAGDARSDTRVG